MDHMSDAERTDIAALAARGGAVEKARVRPRARRLLSHQADRAGLRHHEGVLGDHRGSRRAHRGGIADMAELWTNYIWPLIIIVAQSMLLLVARRGLPYDALASPARAR